MSELDKMQELEERVMPLIAEAGIARSKAMEAIAAAKKGDFSSAETLLIECDTAMTKAHQRHSDFIQDSLDDCSKQVPLLIIHAEDHLMTTILARDFAREIIDLYKTIKQE